MTDARMRELERRFRETGALGDEVAWLRERLRAGELEPERLALAAHLGHAASAQVLEQAPAYLEHPTLLGVEGARCGIYRCELDHAASTGRMKHSPPLGWAVELCCPDALPGTGAFLRVSPKLSLRVARALGRLLGEPVAADAASERLIACALRPGTGRG